MSTTTPGVLPEPARNPELHTITVFHKAVSPHEESRDITFILPPPMKLSVDQFEALEELWSEIKDDFLSHGNAVRELRRSLCEREGDPVITPEQHALLVQLEEEYAGKIRFNIQSMLQTLRKKQLYHRVLTILYIPVGEYYDADTAKQYERTVRRFPIGAVIEGLTLFFTSARSVLQAGFPTFFLQVASRMGAFDPDMNTSEVNETGSDNTSPALEESSTFTTNPSPDSTT